MSRDILYAARALRRNLSFTLIVVATLSIGIGLNVAVFSVANSVLFRAMPYPQADRLAWITNFSLREQRDIFTVNAEYLFWKSQAHSFDKMTGYGDYDVAMVSGRTATQERI